MVLLQLIKSKLVGKGLTVATPPPRDPANFPEIRKRRHDVQCFRWSPQMRVGWDPCRVPGTSTLCILGDASTNHSEARGSPPSLAYLLPN